MMKEELYYIMQLLQIPNWLIRHLFIIKDEYDQLFHKNKI